LLFCLDGIILMDTYRKVIARAVLLFQIKQARMRNVVGHMTVWVLWYHKRLPWHWDSPWFLLRDPLEWRTVRSLYFSL